MSEINETTYAKLAHDNAKLRAFAQAILQDWPDTPCFDGGELQDLAERYGLLEAHEVVEPCGEGCNCAEFDDFPMQCYRKTPLLKGEEPPPDAEP